MQVKLFTPLDVAFWGGLCVLLTALAVGAMLTPQDHVVPPIGWIILWSAIGGVWLVSIGYFVWRWSWIRNLRFVLEPPGFVVGWSDSRYAVAPEEVQALYEDLIARLRPEFPLAEAALRGCIVWFREPSWLQDQRPGALQRRVAGVQDGQYIMVGWTANLKDGALRHELAHRVLQIFAGDPVESVAHARMSRMGVL